MTDANKELLRKIADLCDEASETIATENQHEEEILNTCDKLIELIDNYI